MIFICNNAVMYENFIDLQEYLILFFSQGELIFFLSAALYGPMAMTLGLLISFHPHSNDYLWTQHLLMPAFSQGLSLICRLYTQGHLPFVMATICFCCGCCKTALSPIPTPAAHQLHTEAKKEGVTTGRGINERIKEQPLNTFQAVMWTKSHLGQLDFSSLHCLHSLHSFSTSNYLSK